LFSVRQSKNSKNNQIYFTKTVSNKNSLKYGSLNKKLLLFSTLTEIF